MNLYVLRHAIAVERGTGEYKNDFDRPLTPEGEDKLRQITKAMRSLELSFDHIVSSPYVRARQTAEIVAASLTPQVKVQLFDSLGTDGNPRELITGLKDLSPPPESLLLVGHEPYLSALVSLIVAGGTSSSITLKKAGLCKMTVNSLRAGRCGTLDWLLTPRQLLLMK